MLPPTGPFRLPIITGVVTMAKIEIYTSPYCGYCARAKRLLDSKKAAYTEVDVSSDNELRDKMILRAGGRRTVPQIFIDGKHVGGSDDLQALDATGGLDPLLGN